MRENTKTMQSLYVTRKNLSLLVSIGWQEPSVQNVPNGQPPHISGCLVVLGGSTKISFKWLVFVIVEAQRSQWGHFLLTELSETYARASAFSWERCRLVARSWRRSPLDSSFSAIASIPVHIAGKWSVGRDWPADKWQTHCKSHSHGRRCLALKKIHQKVNQYMGFPLSPYWECCVTSYFVTKCSHSHPLKF